MQTAKSEEDWDVIVVGAGPAGCAAAFDLSTSGRRVLLLDKCEFPRSKACAGGLTMKTVKALRYSVEPVTRQVIRRIVLEKNGENSTLVKTREPICVMTVRAEFDAYCVKKTIEAGATFRRIGGLKQIEPVGADVRLETDTGVLKARFLIGADGVHSQVRRLLGLGSTAGGFALEGQVPLQRGPLDLTFDFGAIRNGYGWIFPKGDHLNMGMGFYGDAGSEKLNRERLMGYVRQRLGTDAVDHVVGQYLAVGGWDMPCAKGKVLLAGDAAGLVDPLTAEGIYSAVASGQAAAKAVEEEWAGKTTAAEAYHRGLKELRDTLAFSARAARAFYANPHRGFQALTFPGLRTALLKTYAYGLNSGTGILRILSRRASV
jgi:geranylgeranyl reductase family protein